MEIEAKLKVASHQPLREALRAAGARFIGRYRERNHIFDQPQIGLRRGGRALRVREVETLDGAARAATVTYKGPVQHAAFKTRPEIELATPDPHRAIELFEGLGFVRTLTFQKRRESWTLGDCAVELDEVPVLGCFIEVEGPDDAAIREALATLGLSGSAHVARSYVGMLTAYCESAGRRDRDIRFDD